MSRLHQLNRAHYLEHCHAEIQLSLMAGDALILIEEAVLKILQQDVVLAQAKQLNIPVYLLEKDALAHGITHSEYDMISAEQWLALTVTHDQHMAW